jgi:hypothetical protein
MFVLIVTGFLYCWVIFNAIRRRLFISAGISTILFGLFVTNHYTRWIFDLLDYIPYFLGLAIIIFLFPVLPVLVHKWEAKRQDDFDNLLHMFVAEEGEFRQHVKERVADEEGWKHIIIEGKECSDVHSLFKEFSYKLRFPRDTEENWYTFDECINDLSWMQAEGYVIFINNANNVFPGDDERFELLIWQLVSARIEWEEEKAIPFQIVLHCTPDNVEETEARVDQVVDQME